MKKTTLCYIKKDNKYLMLFRNKKDNDPCMGKWVGIGGKFEPGETKEECLIREVREETGLILADFSFKGIVHFISNTVEDEDMFLFTSDSFEGNIIDCNEGELSWVPENEILKLNLWDGDKYFLKYILNNETFGEMTCIYDGDDCVEIR